MSWARTIQPGYHPIAAPTEFEGKTILVLWALGGQARPYRAKVSLSKGKKGYAWYIREGSSTVKAKGAEETELLSLAATVPFDDRVNHTARLDDLDPSLIQGFLDEVGSALSDEAPSLDIEPLGRQMELIPQRAKTHRGQGDGHP